MIMLKRAILIMVVVVFSIITTHATVRTLIVILINHLIQTSTVLHKLFHIYLIYVKYVVVRDVHVTVVKDVHVTVVKDVHVTVVNDEFYK